MAAHKDLLEGDPYLKQRLRLCDSYITTLNVCQAYTLKRIRDPNYNVKLQRRLYLYWRMVVCSSNENTCSLNPTGADKADVKSNIHDKPI